VCRSRGRRRAGLASPTGAGTRPDQAGH
jgi:hypothetical protein